VAYLLSSEEFNRKALFHQLLCGGKLHLLHCKIKQWQERRIIERKTMWTGERCKNLNVNRSGYGL
jgi:hypothetical protein